MRLPAKVTGATRVSMETSNVITPIRTAFIMFSASSQQIFFVLNKGVVTNYGEGGATKREGGAREVLPLRKGGAEKVLAILKGRHKKFWGRFYVVA